MRAIRVLIVDDSLFMRVGVRRLLSDRPGFVVAGEAADGHQAIEQVLALRPDVCVMDLNMPVLDGLSALRVIMRRCPTPVVMFSAHTEAGMHETFECLAAGAVDFLPKPAGEVSTGLSAVADLLCQKVRAAALARPGIRPGTVPSPFAASPPSATTPAHAARLAILALSTGGPSLLSALVPQLRRGSKPLIVVQHMPAEFTAALAGRLDRLGPLRVREARTGDLPQRGVVLVAPGDHHLTVAADGSLLVTEGAEVHGVRPAADVTMVSAARVYRGRVIGLVMTGMGRDGTDGLAAIGAAGGSTYAQDRDSCLVYGMPRVAIESGAAERVITPAELPDLLAEDSEDDPTCRCLPESFASAKRASVLST